MKTGLQESVDFVKWLHQVHRFRQMREDIFLWPSLTFDLKLETIAESSKKTEFTTTETRDLKVPSVIIRKFKLLEDLWLFKSGATWKYRR